jgi:hypothetical protein
MSETEITSRIGNRPAPTLARLHELLKRSGQRDVNTEGNS